MDPTKSDTSNAEAMTLSHVNHLKLAWEKEHASVLEITEQLKRCRQQLQAAEENAHIAEASLSLEKLHSEMFSLATRPNCDPSAIVAFVTDWLPRDLDASLACCIKVGDKWVIIESNPENQRIASSGLLDDVVSCCGLTAGGISGAGIIPDDVMNALGWSSDHESVAITIFTRCVWVIIGVSATEAAEEALGYISLLETATELSMSLLSQQIERSEAAASQRVQGLAISLLGALFQPLSDALNAFYALLQAELGIADVWIRIHETSIVYTVADECVLNNSDDMSNILLASDGTLSIEVLCSHDDDTSAIQMLSLLSISITDALRNWLGVVRTDMYGLLAPSPSTNATLQDQPLLYLMQLFNAQWGALLSTTDLTRLTTLAGECQVPQSTSHPPHPVTYAISHLSQQSDGIMTVSNVEGAWAEIICEAAPQLAEASKHAIVCVVRTGTLFVGGRFFSSMTSESASALYEQVRVSRDSDSLYDAAQLLKRGSERADALLQLYAQRCDALDKFLSVIDGNCRIQQALHVSQETLSIIWELSPNTQYAIIVLDASHRQWIYDFSTQQWRITTSEAIDNNSHYMKLQHDSLSVYSFLNDCEWPPIDAISRAWLRGISALITQLIETSLCGHMSTHRCLEISDIVTSVSSSCMELDLYEAQHPPLYAELGITYLTDPKMWRKVFSDALLVVPFLQTQEKDFKCLYRLDAEVPSGLLYEIERNLVMPNASRQFMSLGGDFEVTYMLLNDSTPFQDYTNEVLEKIGSALPRMSSGCIVLLSANIGSSMTVISLVAVKESLAVSRETLAAFGTSLLSALVPLRLKATYHRLRNHVDALQSTSYMRPSMTTIAAKLLETVCCLTSCDAGAIYLKLNETLSKLHVSAETHPFPDTISIVHDIYEVEYLDTVKVIVYQRKGSTRTQIDIILLHELTQQHFCVLRCIGEESCIKLASRCSLLRICDIARSQLQVLFDMTARNEDAVNDLQLEHSKQTGRVIMHLSSAADDINSIFASLYSDDNISIADEISGAEAASVIAEGLHKAKTLTLNQHKQFIATLEEQKKEISEYELSLSSMEQELLHVSSNLSAMEQSKRDADSVLAAQCAKLWTACRITDTFPEGSILSAVQQMTKFMSHFSNFVQETMRELSSSTVHDVVVDIIVSAANLHVAQQYDIYACFYFAWADDVTAFSSQPGVIHAESCVWALRSLKKIVNDDIMYLPLSRGGDVVGVLQCKVSDMSVVNVVLDLLYMTVTDPQTAEKPVSPSRSMRQLRSPTKPQRVSRRCLEAHLHDVVSTGEYADACRLLSSLRNVTGVAVLLKDTSETHDLYFQGKCNYRGVDGGLSAVDLRVNVLDLVTALDDKITVGSSFLSQQLYIADDITIVRYVFPLIYMSAVRNDIDFVAIVESAAGVIVIESTQPLLQSHLSFVDCVLAVLKLHHNHQYQHQAFQSSSHVVQDLRSSLHATQQELDLASTHIRTVCLQWEACASLQQRVILGDIYSSTFCKEMKQLLGDTVLDIKILSDIAMIPDSPVSEADVSLIPFSDALQHCLASGTVVAPHGFRDSDKHSPYVLYTVGYSTVLIMQCSSIDAYKTKHGDIPSCQSYAEFFVSLMKHVDAYRELKEEANLIEVSERYQKYQSAFAQAVIASLDSKENDAQPSAGLIAKMLNQCFDSILVNERVQWYDNASATWMSIQDVDDSTWDVSEMRKLMKRGVVIRNDVAYVGIAHENGVSGWLLHVQLSVSSYPQAVNKQLSIVKGFQKSLSACIALFHHAMLHKCGSKRSNAASSISAEKLDVTTRVLQELFAPGMKLDAMLKGVENTLLNFPDAQKVSIICRENASNRVLYRSSGLERAESNGIAFARSSSSASSLTLQTSPHRLDSRGMSSVEYSEDVGNSADGLVMSTGKSRVFRFASCDVSGEIIISVEEGLSEADMELLSALCRTIGRRAYELYRGSRSKKALVEAQRSLQETRLMLQEKDLHLATIDQRKSELEAERTSLQQQLSILRERLSNESKELTATSKAKKESERQLRRQLEDLRHEFEKKERSMLNSLQGLKTQGGGLSKQLEEALRIGSAAAAERDAVIEKLNKSEQRKKQLAQELVSRRTEFEAKEKDLMSQLNKYQMELRELHNTKTILEDRIKALSATADDRLRSANERVLAVEKELAAAKSSASFLKQQNAASSRALQQTQDELERVKVRTLRHSQSTAL